MYKNISKDYENKKGFKVSYIPNIDEIETIYDKIIDNIWNNNYLDIDEIKEIIKIY